MIKRLKCKCIECNKSDTFEDDVDIRRTKWTILAWNVATGEPICLCDKCEWKPVGKNENSVHKTNSPK